MKHSWVSEGCHPHNGEYWYKCSVCGKRDWVSSTGNPNDLPQDCPGPKVIAAQVLSTTGETMNVENVVQSIMVSHFDNMAKAFSTNPSATNWNLLETAMWARQMIATPTGLQEAAELVRELPITKWPDVMAAARRGKVI